MTNDLASGDALHCPNCGHHVATVTRAEPVATVATSARLGVVKAFADDCLEPRVGSDLSNARLHEEYTRWATEHGHEPMSMKGFSMAMDGLGYQRFRRATMRGYRDLVLTKVHLSHQDS